MKYFAYVRKSEEDKKRQIQSISKQNDWCKETAEKRGIDIETFFADTQSAHKPGRKGFADLMKAVYESNEPVGIITWRISRLARNGMDEGTIKYAFQEKRIKHIIAGDREYDENANHIIMGVDFGQATQYSIQLSKDVNEGMQKKVEKGWRPTAAPLGYLNEPFALKGERKIVIDPERWALLQKAWERMLTRAYSVPEIKEWLVDEGFTTKKGNKVALSTLYALFKNPFYSGRFRWKGSLVHGKHKPMITIKEFNSVQEFLNNNETSKRKKHYHPYTGLIKCAECGCMITAEPPKIKRQKNGIVHTYHYMRCTKRKNEVTCDQPCVRLEYLEDQIENELSEIEVPFCYLGWMRKKSVSLSKKHLLEVNTKLYRIDKEVSECKELLKSLTDKFVRNQMDNETYQDMKLNYEKKISSLKQKRKKISDGKSEWIKSLQSHFEFASEAYKKFKKGKPQEKRLVFARLSSNLSLNNRKLAVQLKMPYEQIKNSLQELECLKHRLEPLKNASMNEERPLLKEEIAVWSSFVEDFRTSFQEEDIE